MADDLSDEEIHEQAVALAAGLIEEDRDVSPEAGELFRQGRHDVIGDDEAAVPLCIEPGCEQTAEPGDDYCATHGEQPR
jgi:hypothetical protein